MKALDFKVFTYTILLILICYISYSVHGQNLVHNGSFELNDAFVDSKKIKLSDNFNHVISWKMLGWQSFYCHTGLELASNWYVSSCRSTKYFPRTGDAMIKMVYEENCFSDQSLRLTKRQEGCASYLTSKFTSPLEVGGVYEMSFWVFFPKDSIVEKSILGNIGFIPTLRETIMSQNNMLNYSKFFNETIEFDQWFQIKKYIRALCPLEYIVIGAFRNDAFPTVHRHTLDHYPFYFIDDVKVEKISEDEIDEPILPTPFCKFYNDEYSRPKKIAEQELILYFDSNVYTLTKSQESKLDSFVKHTEIHDKPVYTIIGHTDSTGRENSLLSLNRSLSAKSYLEKNFSIPVFRLVNFGVGHSLPAGSEHAPENRANNRRVVIKTNLLSVPQGIYRQGLYLISSNEVNRATALMVKWIQIAPGNQKMAILHDPRLDNVKKHPGWIMLVNEVRKEYANLKKPNDAFYLDSMYFVDQRHRSFAPYYLTGYIPGIDTFSFDLLDVDVERYRSIDSLNMVTMKHYLRAHGFPKISEVGRRQVRTVGYMIIHTEDSALMRKYLPILEANCLEGEAEWDLYAMVFDKYRWCQGLPQLFGTQSVFINEEKTQLQLYKLDSIEEVNKRRIKIGLSPIDNKMEIIYIKKM